MLHSEGMVSLRTVYKIANFLGIVPSYSFKKTDLVHHLRDKIFGTLLSIFMTIGIIHSIYVQWTELNDKFPVTHVIIFRLNNTCSLSFNLYMIMGSAFWNRAKWQNLNNYLMVLDKKLENPRKKVCYGLGNVYVQLGVIHLAVILHLVYWYILLMGMFGFVGILVNLITDFCFYYILFAQFLLFQYNTTLKRHYQNLNKMLQTRPEQQKVSLREMELLSRILKDCVDFINDVFGWPLLFLFGRTVLELLVALDVSIVIFGGNETYLGSDSIISEAAFGLLIAIPLIFVVMSCDSVVLESRKMVDFSYKPVDHKQTKEMIYFVKSLERNVAKFTAAMFFEIDRRTLLWILGTTTTYLIVIMQLK